MSHWQAGKLNLSCSEDILHSAIVAIMPEWERSIQVSEEGSLSIVDMDGAVKTGYNIKIPKSAPGVSYCDLGMQRQADGTWSIDYDNMGLPQKMKNTPNKLKDEVGAMQARALARQNGLSIQESSQGGVKKIKIRIPKQKAMQILGQ